MPCLFPLEKKVRLSLDDSQHLVSDLLAPEVQEKCNNDISNF